jgi:hypothetical protein
MGQTPQHWLHKPAMRENAPRSDAIERWPLLCRLNPIVINRTYQGIGVDFNAGTVATR